MTIKIDIENDLKEIMLDIFDNKYLLKRFCINVDTIHLAEIKNKNLTTLLHIYLNLYDRLLFCRKSKVLFSKEIKQNKLYKQYRLEIQKIQKIFECGSSIRPFLSERVNNLIYSKSVDGLLLDWGLHHLHIFPKQKRNPTNDNLLLFIMKQGDYIYFIDILTHKDFFNFHLLEIIHNNWKDTLNIFKLDGMHPDILTEENFKNLRKYNVSYTIGFKDEPEIAYGTQIRKAIQINSINYLLHTIKEFQKNILSDEKKILNVISEKLHTEISDIEIKMVKNNNTIIYIEPKYSIKFDFQKDEQNIKKILKEFRIIK